MGALVRSVALLSALVVAAPAPADGERPWRSLPLITAGKVDPAWAQIGHGGFGVDGGALRTDCDPRGMGLLLYTKEKFGDCQIRVVYKVKDARSNAGVYVRVDEGMAKRLKEKPAAVRRGEDGKLSPDELAKLKQASAKEQGPWYAVHHGYEVQICDTGGEYNRTGAVYSLSKAAALPRARPDGWRTMVITLQGEKVLVEIDGKAISAFDPAGKEVPRERQWHEPRREPKRPRAGYLGLQNHDPGDVVWFKEISVRPLADGR